MTVSYTQFIAEFPEFADAEQGMVDPVLELWDSFLSGFENLHDRAVYRRTALELSQSVFGMPMADQSTEQNKYINAWRDILVLNPRRGTISGGGAE